MQNLVQVAYHIGTVVAIVGLNAKISLILVERSKRMNRTTAKLRKIITVLALLLGLQTVVLLVLLRPHLDGWFSAESMNAFAHRLFSSKSSPRPTAPDPVIEPLKADAGDIQELHAKIERLFSDLMTNQAGPAGVVSLPGSQHDFSRHIHQLQQEMDSVFARMFDYDLWHQAPHPLGWCWEQASVAPALQMTEDEDIYEISVALSGMDRLSIGVHLQEDILSISARGRHGSYMTRLLLPGAADKDNIQAHYEDDLLRIKVPKHYPSKNKKQEILAEDRKII